VTRSPILTLTTGLALRAVRSRRARLVTPDGEELLTILTRSEIVLLQSSFPSGRTGAGAGDVIALPSILAFAHLLTALAVLAVGALDVALSALPARSAGALAAEGIAVGAVQAGAVVAAILAPLAGRTRCSRERESTYAPTFIRKCARAWRRRKDDVDQMAASDKPLYEN